MEQCFSIKRCRKSDRSDRKKNLIESRSIYIFFQIIFWAAYFSTVCKQLQLFEGISILCVTGLAAVPEDWPSDQWPSALAHSDGRFPPSLHRRRPVQILRRLLPVQSHLPQVQQEPSHLLQPSQEEQVISFRLIAKNVSNLQHGSAEH